MNGLGGVLAQKEEREKVLNAMQTQSGTIVQNLQTQYQQAMSEVNTKIASIQKANEAVIANTEKMLLSTSERQQRCLQIENAIQIEASKYIGLSYQLEEMNQELEGRNSRNIELENITNTTAAQGTILNEKIERLNILIDLSTRREAKAQEELLTVIKEVNNLRKKILLSDDGKMEKISEQSKQIMEMSAMLNSLLFFSGVVVVEQDN